jgi:hypothetical protein
VPTVRVSQVPGKRSSCPTKPSIWWSQATAWFQLAFVSQKHCLTELPRPGSIPRKFAHVP